MTTAKIYPLNVESEVEELSAGAAKLRGKAMSTLVDARAEYEQIHSSQTATERKKGRQTSRGDRQLWVEIEERIENAFESLEEAIRQIRKPFWK
jgi:hypothetical protein